MARARFILIIFVLLFVGACSQAQKEAPQQQAPPAQAQQPQQPAPAPEMAPPQQAQAPAPTEPARTRTSAREKARPRTVTQKAPPEQAISEQTPAPVQAAPPVQNAAAPPVRQVPAEPPAPRYAVIPSGSSLIVRLQDPLDTAVNQDGDGFRAVLDRDLIVDGNLVAPRGTVLQGKLSHVERAGRVQGRAAMSLQLTDLKIAGQSYPILTNLLSFEAESTKKQDAAKVGIGAGIGAVIGAIAGGGKGAAIGAAVGGGAGGATVVATRGKEVKLESERSLTFSLQKDVQVRLQ